MKKYLFIGPDIVAGVGERYVVDIKSAIDWVDGPEEASADYEDAAKVTQGKLAELGIETHLEEIPHRRHPGSRWVICKED
jgi:hypothetical protein